MFYRKSKLHRSAVSLKSQILGASPETKTYRNYKFFDVNKFNEDLKSKLDLIAQPVSTYSKLTIESLEQGVKYIQS